MRHRGRHPLLAIVLDRKVIVGAFVVVASLVVLQVAYNSSRGVPLLPGYEITVDVRDAAELVAGSSEVRIGGSRAGLISEIEAIPGTDGERPHARLTLKLNGSVEPLPIDSTVAVRLRSLLGAKYLDVIPGDSDEVVPAGGTLPVTKLVAPVEVDEAIQILDERTTKALQGTIIGLGDAFAGRGGALNETVGHVAEGMAPLQRVLEATMAPETDLRGFIDGAITITGALEPVAPALGSLIAGGATTLAALDAAGEALPRAIAELPPTLEAGSRTLDAALPVLDDAAEFLAELRSGSELLPEASSALADTVEGATPVLEQTPRVADNLSDTLAAANPLLRSPATENLLAQLVATVDSLGQTLELLTPAQLQCNVAGLFARNVSSAASGGDLDGTWLNFVLILEGGLMFQSGRQSGVLHMNPLPNQSWDECESGNEPFVRGTHVGNPDGLQQNTTEDTASIGVAP